MLYETSASSFRSRQQGGLTIIMALVLVGVMGAATFGLSRNAIRELSMAGTIIQGNKAAAAADAGLDWAITWGQGTVDAAGFTAAGATTSQVNYLAALQSNINSNYLVTTLAGSSVPAMTLNQGGAANTDQNFDLEVRFLGSPAASSTGSSSNLGASGGTAASGPTSGGGTATVYVWRILATGHATPKNAQTYQAQRELVASRTL